MSACAIKHWGTGTPCVKTTSPAAKELSDKLKAMQAARDMQDSTWHAPVDKKSTTPIECRVKTTTQLYSST
jgi:hypothetical protein